MTRHLLNKHPELREELEVVFDPKIKRFKSDVATKATLLLSIVDYVVCYNTAFENFGTDMLRLALQQTARSVGLKKVINAANVRFLILEVADHMKQLLKNELMLRRLHMKVDLSTRKNKRLLGANVQYMEDGAIKIRNLAMTKVDGSITGSYIVEKLKCVCMNPDYVTTI